MCGKSRVRGRGCILSDLIKLRRLTAQQNVPLYLKIGGVEALRDIKDALDIDVDGLIAPMVESPFGVVKFVGAVESVFGQREFFKSINIETREAVQQIDEILDVAKGKIDNVTIGRTDLSHSYFDSKIEPDSPFILDFIERLSYKICSSGLSLTVGGSVTSESIRLFSERRERLGDRMSSMETRKSVLPIDRILGQKNALEEALRFKSITFGSNWKAKHGFRGPIRSVWLN